MAPVPEECVMLTPEQNPTHDVAPDVAPAVEPAPITTVVEAPQRSGHLPPQVSRPIELNAKLERQDSCESVGSMEEEGIHEGNEDSESQDSEGHEEGHEGSELEPRSERSSSVVSDGSEEGGRDSGIEAEREPDMIVPDDDLMTRIVDHVEFYFSDANVAKDKFLLKHIRRNKEGYVSLKLVSSFKKVRQVTKDWRVVAYALNKVSTKIQANDLGTKIRRVEPLPPMDDTPQTCAVLALSLPLEKPTIQNVSELFAACGEIALLRLVRAGATIPQDIKTLAAKHPALNDSHCACIEFESADGAKAALELNTEDGMKVVPVLPEKKKEEKQPQQQKNSRPNSRRNSTSSNAPSVNSRPNSRKNSTQQQHQYIKGRKISTSGNGSDGENGTYMRQPRRKCVSLPQTQCPNLRELSAVVEARRFRPKSKSCTEFPSGSPPTSWVQRHLFAAAAASAASAASPVGSRPSFVRPERVSQGSLPLPEGVMRFPKGPDGSRGFAARKVSVTIVEAT